MIVYRKDKAVRGTIMDKNFVATAYIILITFAFGAILYLFPEHKETQPWNERHEAKGTAAEQRAGLDFSPTSMSAAKNILCSNGYAGGISSC